MFALTFAIHDDGDMARLWIRRRRTVLEKPTVKINTRPDLAEVEALINSFADYYPKTRTPMWLVTSAYPITAPKMYNVRIRSTKLVLGPYVPGTVLAWDEAYELWLAHARFAVTRVIES